MDTHIHIAKYRSSPNASKKPAPRRFKHDSLAQRLNPDKHTHSCTPTRIHTLTDRETETNSPPSTTPNQVAPKAGLLGKLIQFSGWRGSMDIKQRGGNFLFTFWGSALLIVGLSGAPPKHKGERCPSRWYRLTLSNMSFAAALKTSRFLHKCIWGSQLVISCSTRQLA